MKALKHTKAHPGFDAVAGRIAKSEGMSMNGARAVLASKTRKAGMSARKSNPRLNRVKGY